MRKLTYYIGTTLDGYAAGPGGEIDVYPVSEDHLAHMVEAYPEVLRPYSHLRQYVASTTMHRSPDPEVTIVSDALATGRELKAEDGLDIYLAGGGRVAGSVRDEIDELIVKVYPVLAGQDVSMFAGDFVPRRFELSEQQSFTSGVAVLSYTRSDQG